MSTQNIEQGLSNNNVESHSNVETGLSTNDDVVEEDDLLVRRDAGRRRKDKLAELVSVMTYFNCFGGVSNLGNCSDEFYTRQGRVLISGNRNDEIQAMLNLLGG
jgi:hypothetical protein